MSSEFKNLEDAVHYIKEMSVKLIQGADLEDYYEYSIIPAIHESFPEILKCTHAEWEMVHGVPDEDDDFLPCYARCKECGCMGTIEGMTTSICTYFMAPEGNMAGGPNLMMHIKWVQLPCVPIKEDNEQQKEEKASE